MLPRSPPLLPLGRLVVASSTVHSHVHYDGESPEQLRIMNAVHGWVATPFLRPQPRVARVHR